PDPARRREQSEHLADRQRRDDAEFLAELQERRELPGRRPDAAAPGGVARRAASDAGGDRGPVVAPAAEQPRRFSPDDHTALAQPLQRPAGPRRLREPPGHRLGLGAESRRQADSAIPGPAPQT